MDKHLRLVVKTSKNEYFTIGCEKSIKIEELKSSIIQTYKECYFNDAFQDKEVQLYHEIVKKTDLTSPKHKLFKLRALLCPFSTVGSLLEKDDVVYVSTVAKEASNCLISEEKVTANVVATTNSIQPTSHSEGEERHDKGKKKTKVLVKRKSSSKIVPAIKKKLKVKLKMKAQAAPKEIETAELAKHMEETDATTEIADNQEKLNAPIEVTKQKMERRKEGTQTSKGGTQPTKQSNIVNSLHYLATSTHGELKDDSDSDSDAPLATSETNGSERVGDSKLTMKQNTKLTTDSQPMEQDKSVSIVHDLATTTHGQLKDDSDSESNSDSDAPLATSAINGSERVGDSKLTMKQNTKLTTESQPMEQDKSVSIVHDLATTTHGQLKDDSDSESNSDSDAPLATSAINGSERVADSKLTMKQNTKLTTESQPMEQDKSVSIVYDLATTAFDEVNDDSDSHSDAPLAVSAINASKRVADSKKTTKQSNIVNSLNYLTTITHDQLKDDSDSESNSDSNSDSDAPLARSAINASERVVDSKTNKIKVKATDKPDRDMNSECNKSTDCESVLQTQERHLETVLKTQKENSVNKSVKQISTINCADIKGCEPAMEPKPEAEVSVEPTAKSDVKSNLKCNEATDSEPLVPSKKRHLEALHKTETQKSMHKKVKSVNTLNTKGEPKINSKTEAKEELTTTAVSESQSELPKKKKKTLTSVTKPLKTKKHSTKRNEDLGRLKNLAVPKEKECKKKKTTRNMPVEFSFNEVPTKFLEEAHATLGKEIIKKVEN